MRPILWPQCDGIFWYSIQCKIFIHLPSLCIAYFLSVRSAFWILRVTVTTKRCFSKRCEIAFMPFIKDADQLLMFNAWKVPRKVNARIPYLQFQMTIGCFQAQTSPVRPTNRCLGSDFTSCAIHFRSLWTVKKQLDTYSRPISKAAKSDGARCKSFRKRCPRVSRNNYQI